MMNPRTLVALGVLVATAACGGGAGPELAPISDQIVQVGTEVNIQLIGTDSDGDALTYSFDSNVPDIQSRATVSLAPNGTGVFRWTPLAADVGTWFFDFTVSDGGGDDTITAQIEVKSAVGQNGAPVFREPLGTGTTLDLEVRQCLDVDVVIEDQDSTSVDITQTEPIIEGASLMSTGGLTARWRWCPTDAQIDAADRYNLLLAADDLTNPKTVKDYLIVLRKEMKEDCEGNPPAVSHAPSDESTLTSLTISANISDDMGLKQDPLFYYSTSPQADPPDLGSMTQTSMVLITGDMQSGTWAADVPNPVADQGMGAQATIYYVIVANDDDDPAGDCDHLTQAPASGTYSMTVTNPGGTGGASVCESCTTDVQCGGSADLCVRVGQAAESFCLQECTGPSDCPTDYTCSVDPVESVDGAMARQCVPNSNDCSNPGGTICADDTFEDNDSLAQAADNMPIDTGSHNFTSCPASLGDDEDWFEIDVQSAGQVTLNLSGGTQSDLDLGLYTDANVVVKISGSLDSDEMISECLEPGLYYVRVYAWGAEENDYSLTYSHSPMSCGGEMCDDDEEEDDDNASQARMIDIYPTPYDSDTNAICPDDQDWFAIEMYDQETVVVDLTFGQANSTEDLDVYVYDDNDMNLTPCCDINNGQSGTDDEHLEYQVNDAACENTLCTFYVVVDGYNGSSNLYDIDISLILAP
jgi:hypothetical protein